MDRVLPALTDEELDAVRAEREGQAWLQGGFGLEGAPLAGPASTRDISDTAFNLIVEFEVSSEATYTARYRAPTWPQGQSGVTIGIGYDIGYVSRDGLHADFDGAIPAAMITALEKDIGVKGDPARALAASLHGAVDVPWDAAIGVHRDKVIPRWTGLVERTLSNTDALTDDQLGALVSLTYNRGASFTAQGDRYTQMRAIHQHMAASNFGAIPGDLRDMKKIWPTVPGLQKRREREALLFETGL